MIKIVCLLCTCSVADAVHEAESKQGQLGKSISYR